MSKKITDQEVLEILGVFEPVLEAEIVEVEKKVKKVSKKAKKAKAKADRNEQRIDRLERRLDNHIDRQSRRHCQPVQQVTVCNNRKDDYTGFEWFVIIFVACPTAMFFMWLVIASLAGARF